MSALRKERPRFFLADTFFRPVEWGTNGMMFVVFSEDSTEYANMVRTARQFARFVFPYYGLGSDVG